MKIRHIEISLDYAILTKYGQPILSLAGIESGSPALQVDSLPAHLPGNPPILKTQMK